VIMCEVIDGRWLAQVRKDIGCSLWQGGVEILGGWRCTAGRCISSRASAMDPLVLSVDSACLFESKHTASRSSGY